MPTLTLRDRWDATAADCDAICDLVDLVGRDTAEGVIALTAPKSLTGGDRAASRPLRARAEATSAAMTVDAWAV